jgi:hypothetical protein
MAIDDARPCRGSGLTSHWANDARGIPLARVCGRCRKEKLSHYRRGVLTNLNYYCDEPVELDE